MNQFSWTEDTRVGAVMTALNGVGEARFVGGCVRDSLLGLVPGALEGEGTTDIDIATTLLPGETTAALAAAGLAAHPTGIDHGTVTAVSDGLAVEVTTLRADVATDGRHAEVRFTTDWDEDWRRRDFRINAMYLSADGALYDPAGGRDDLASHRVRFIGDPDERIAEDYLRILRFFRFSSRYADVPDADGLTACARNCEGMGRLSKERIWQETAKIFATPKAPTVLQAAGGAGVLAKVLDAVPQYSVFERLHAILCADVAPALGLLSLWPDADRAALKSAFKPSKATLDRVDAARQAHARITADHGTALLRALFTHGVEAVCDAALLHAAQSGEAKVETWLDLHMRANATPVPVFPLQARAFIARGLQPGPNLGRALAMAKADWLANGCRDDGLDRILEDAVQAFSG